jgi:hypothetical protein
MDGSLHQETQEPAVLPMFAIVGTLEAQTKLMTELALARLEFGDIEKDRTGQYGYQQFKYATLGMLTASTMPALARHGIAVMQAITNSPTEAGRQRITTMLCGHGARIVSSLDFDPRLTQSEKGEPIKEYGKLRTYLRRYEYQTLLMLDAEPDADEAGVKPSNEPQKRREPPTPPQGRQEQRPAPRPEPAPKAVDQKPAPSNQGQLQMVPPPAPKPDPLAEKLSTPVPVTETPVAPPGPTVTPVDDPPASQALQNELLEVYRKAGMTRIQFGQLCLDTVGVPSGEVRDSTANSLKVLEAMKQKIAGAA